jgi:hypothetical protein
MDPGTIVYSRGLSEFTQTLTNPNMDILDEMADCYGDIEIGYHPWDDNSRPQFINFDTAQVQTQDYLLHMNVASWMNFAEHAGLGVRTLYLENSPEVSDSEQPEEDHGDVLENMYAFGVIE